MIRTVRTQKMEDGTFGWIILKVWHENGHGNSAVLATGTESSRAKAMRAGRKARQGLTSTD